MITFINETGTKKVKIITDATGTIMAMFIQIYNFKEQVLETKIYKSIKFAKKWAMKKLS